MPYFLRVFVLLLLTCPLVGYATNWDQIYEEMFNSHPYTEEARAHVLQAQIEALKRAEGFKDLLSEVEYEAIVKYTVTPRVFNKYLKMGVPLSDAVNSKARLLFNALSKLPPDEFVVYRGMISPKGKIGSSLAKGDTVHFGSFTSTSYSIYQAKEFSTTQNPSMDSVVFRIEQKSGKNISSLSQWQGEKAEAELLINPDTKFRINSKRRGPDGTLYINLVEKSDYQGAVKNVYAGLTPNCS